MAVDELLTTKTALCRLAYPGKQSNCIYEDEEKYGECTPGELYCMRRIWRADVAEDVALVWNVTDERLKLSNTEYADCDVDKWCQKGKCVAMTTAVGTWWQQMGPKSKPFPTDQEKKEQHGDMGWQDENNVNAHHGTQVSDSAWNRVKAAMERYKDCNMTVCKAGVRNGLVVDAHKWDSPAPDPVTGKRPLPCIGYPSKVQTCRMCQRYTPKPVGCDMQCRCNTTGNLTLAHDGMECSRPDQQSLDAAACLMGSCYITHPIE